MNVNLKHHDTTFKIKTAVTSESHFRPYYGLIVSRNVCMGW